MRSHSRLSSAFPLVTITSKSKASPSIALRQEQAAPPQGPLDGGGGPTNPAGKFDALDKPVIEQMFETDVGWLA